LIVTLAISIAFTGTVTCTVLVFTGMSADEMQEDRIFAPDVAEAFQIP
jgi:hypothetical protein